MAKFIDYYSDPEVREIIDGFLERFPQVFEGFVPDLVAVIYTRTKKSKVPIKVQGVTYPFSAYISKVYVFQVFETVWKELDAKKKNLAVFHAMCAVPLNGFDESSKEYAKVKQPEIKMYMLEFAVSGGIPNWLSNEAARDPMEVPPESVASDEEGTSDAIPGDGIRRVPVTPGGIMGVVGEEESA